MKKLITILTVVAVFGLAGCGGSGSPRVVIDPNLPNAQDRARADAAGKVPILQPVIVLQASIDDVTKVPTLSSVSVMEESGTTTFTVEGTIPGVSSITGFTPTVALTSDGLIPGKGIFEDVADNPCARLAGECTPLEINEDLSASDVLQNLAQSIFDRLPMASQADPTITAASIATLLATSGSTAYSLLPGLAREVITSTVFDNLIALPSYTQAAAVPVTVLGQPSTAGMFLNQATFNNLLALNTLIREVNAANLGETLPPSNFDASIVRWKYGTTADHYLNLSYWIFTPDGDNDANANTGVNVGVGVHGDDPFTPANVAGLTGIATYNGNAFGRAGRTSFVADVGLTANFGDGTDGGMITGTIDEFNHDPSLEVTLGAAAIVAGSNSFTGVTSASTGDIFSAKAGAGNWGGRFYGNGGTNPLAVGGTFGVANGDDINAVLGVFGAGLVVPPVTP